ncbi:MAG: transposase [Armatimonadetes bacterium]|nr:transposase [Armatimonadota bacterium]
MGLQRPLLIISDDHSVSATLACWKAAIERFLLVVSDDGTDFPGVGEVVWRQGRWQPCVNHEPRAAFHDAPAGLKKQLVAEAQETFPAPTRAEAARGANELCKRWWRRGRRRVQSLMGNPPLAPTFYDFPVSWHDAIRSSNASEGAMRGFRDALPRAGGGAGTTHGAIALLLASATHLNQE